MRKRTRRYYKSNPLSTTELVVGGLAAAAVAALGGVLIYQHYNPSASLAAGPSYPAQPSGAGPTTPYDPSNPATYGGPGTPSTAVPPGG